MEQYRRRSRRYRGGDPLRSYRRQYRGGIGDEDEADEVAEYRRQSRRYRGGGVEPVGLESPGSYAGSPLTEGFFGGRRRRRQSRQRRQSRRR